MCWPLNLQENHERKRNNFDAIFVCFQMHNKSLTLKYFIVWVMNYLFLKKLHYFRGSHFSQCFILLLARHRTLPSKFLCLQVFLVITDSVQENKWYTCVWQNNYIWLDQFELFTNLWLGEIVSFWMKWCLKVKAPMYSKRRKIVQTKKKKNFKNK